MNVTRTFSEDTDKSLKISVQYRKETAVTFGIHNSLAILYRNQVNNLSVTDLHLQRYNDINYRKSLPRSLPDHCDFSHLLRT